MGKGTCWDKEEDVALARAWVAASEDPLIGVNQKAKSFWQRVFDIWITFVPREVLEKSERTTTSLPPRWKTINADVASFCGRYDAVRSVEKSGWTEDMYFQEALTLFKDEGKGRKQGREFLFEGCWRILKDSPKWRGGCGYIRKANLNDVKSANSEEEVDLTERPTGVKKAKKEAKKVDSIEKRHLQIDEMQANAMQRKARAQELAAITDRDKFFFSLFSLQPDSQEAKEWFSLKASEALAEMKERAAAKRRESGTVLLELDIEPLTPTPSRSNPTSSLSNSSRAASNDDAVSVTEIV